MDASDHGKVVLSAILAGGGSIKALDYALARITPEHLVDPVQRTLFIICQRYADQTRGVLSRAALGDLLRDREPGKALMYAEYYDAMAAAPPALDQFLHSVTQLRELAAERSTGEALAQGMEILRNGARDERGRELRGHEDARAYVLAELAAVERDSGLASSPEGDIRRESDDLHARYAKAKELRLQGTAPGVSFGLEALDARFPGGLNPGELCLVCGWTSAGKSSVCAHLAWHLSTQQGRNVVIFTTETLRPQVHAKIVARHSRQPQFGLPQGLNSRDIRSGWLDERGERALRQVLSDFGSNPDYGRCYVVQVPRRGTLSGMESRLQAISRQFRPDLVIIDYLQLFYPDRSRRESGEREDQSGIVKDAKQVAATFAQGTGVPVVSPWQVNRVGRERLKEAGGYSLENMAGTQEAANTADIVLGLVDPLNDTSHGRNVPIELTVMKNRDGERGGTFRLTADFATSFFSSRDRTTDEEALLGG